MRTYFFKNPFWLSLIYRGVIWRKEDSEKSIYLTFDDGPTPEVTDFALNELTRVGAKATFFLLGKNMRHHPELISHILSKGHVIGNHTMNHLDGWKTKTRKYLSDIADCQYELNRFSSGKLFRPPYGNLRSGQRIKIGGLGYKIVMWSHLSGDFDQELNVPHALDKLKKANSGSILVFHDTEKAFANLREILPKVLDHFSTLGYQFKSL